MKENTSTNFTYEYFPTNKEVLEIIKKEKEKCKWIKENLKIPILVASKSEKRGEIIYEQV